MTNRGDKRESFYTAASCSTDIEQVAQAEDVICASNATAVLGKALLPHPWLEDSQMVGGGVAAEAKI